MKNFLKGYSPEKHEIISKSNCTKCYGRGFIGINTTLKIKQPCVCLRLQNKVKVENESNNI